MRRTVILVALAAAVTAAPAAAQSPSTQTDPSLVMTVSSGPPFYDPINDERRHQVSLVVTCGVLHVDDPSYVVELRVRDGPAEMTVVTDVNPLRAAFDPTACLDTTTNQAALFNNVTVSMPATTEAFSDVSFTINASLARDAAADAALAGAEDQVAFQVAYVPGLAVDVPAVQLLLREGTVMVNFTAHNRANGETTVTATTTEADDGLTLSMPEPFTLARAASQEASFAITSLLPCAQRFRSAQVLFVGTSPTHPEQGASEKTATLSIECVPEPGRSPGAGPLAWSMAAGVAVALTRRLGRR